MEKVIRDDLVAVLYSPGCGAGWYTWNSEHQELLFNPKIVEMVEFEKTNEITEEWISDNLGISGVYCGGANKLCIGWLPKGTLFDVGEYDGSESIITIKNLPITT